MKDHGRVREWDDLLREIPPERCDVYFSEAYVRLYEDADYEAEAFFYRDDEGLMVIPYLRIENPYLSGRHDSCTPYGYGGPVSDTDDEGFLARAEEAFRETMRDGGFVSVFFRFHPMLSNQRLLPRMTEARFDRNTVWMDLSLPWERVWEEQFDRQARNRTQRALSAGLCFTMDDRCEALEDFVAMYHATMARLEADAFYFFSHDYFRRMHGQLGESTRLATVRTVEGEVVAANLILSGDWCAHGHLSCSKPEFMRLGGNNLLMSGLLRGMSERGFSRFHVGGGATPDDGDGLLAFKRHFSRHLGEFYTGRVVLDEESYSTAAAMAEERGGLGDGGRFPVYGLPPQRL